MTWHARSQEMYGKILASDVKLDNKNTHVHRNASYQ